MKANVLTLLLPQQLDRVGRDRLEILTTLINGPSFDPLMRGEFVWIPRGHKHYRWECVVAGCQRARGGSDLCSIHRIESRQARDRGVAKAAFLDAAQPLAPVECIEETVCRVCPQRPAAHAELRLCQRHLAAWYRRLRQPGQDADFTGWLVGQVTSFAGYGGCRALVCANLAESPLGLCAWHGARYQREGRPGGAALPDGWWRRRGYHGRPIPVAFADEDRFRRWCATVDPVLWPGQINLRGLRPLVRAELQWGLFIHTQRPHPTRWDLGWIRKLVGICRTEVVTSLADLDLDGRDSFTVAIVQEILRELRLVYFTPADTREAGFLETTHFGVRFRDRLSHVDLTGIPQRWLRDLAWDHLADMLRSPRCPRTAAVVDGLRRATVELGAYLDLDAPGGGHDPALLREEHMLRFVADQRQRERDGLASLVIKRRAGMASVVTSNTRNIVFNAVRRLLRGALEIGIAEHLGLDRQFITAMPAAGAGQRRARRPFSDEVARALADETNLGQLAEAHDLDDQGMRDIWEAIVFTGRRAGEVVNLRWDCLGRLGGLPMFWHDQTKVGNYDTAIRIPERLHHVLTQRQRKTLDRFTARRGRRPTDAERAGLALFPSKYRNSDGTAALTYTTFLARFRAWVDELDLGYCVPHQARHTLATNLLRHGASLTHVRRYLGQVSDRMAEHYVHLSNSDLEDVLQYVWVTGPGTADPGRLLTSQTTAALSREQAQALAVDLARRSTPPRVASAPSSPS